MQKTNSLKPVHKHALATIIAAGFVCLWVFVINPKTAIGLVGVPTGFAGTAGDEKVELEWDRPDGSSIGVDPTSYRIYYVADGSKEGEQMLETEEPVFSYIISGLTNNVEYTFTITGVHYADEGVESDRSNPLKLTPTSGKEGGGGISLSGEPTVRTTATTATIEWATTLDGTSLVYYGPTEDFSGNTPRDEITKTQDHSVEITGLASCVGYWFKVVSYDDDENLAESSGGEFKTTGCKGESEIVTYQASKATTSTGTVVQAKVSGRGLEATVPANLKSGLSEVGVEALKLEKNRVQPEISTPTGKNWVGQAYSLKAFEDEKTELDEEFDAPVSVSIDYTSEDVAGLDLDSLRIYHYTDGIGWEVLSNCTNNINHMVVTCETTSFSIFALFGTEQSGGGQTTSSGSYVKPSAPTTIATTPATTAPVNKPAAATVKSNQSFAKNLGMGQKDADVKALQVFLNNNGFLVASTGPGSKGSETEFFGPLTFAALIKFQEAHKNEILAPYSLSSGTGFFGAKTKAFISAIQ